VVAVLHGDDRDDLAGLGELRTGDAAEPQMTDQPLTLQVGQGAQRLHQRHVVGNQQPVAADAQVHQLEPVHPQLPQVVLDLVAELRRLGGSREGPPLVADHADLGGHHQVCRVGVQRPAEQLVGHLGPVGVAGVDVGDAEVHGSSQHGDGGVAVLGRPPDAGAGQLHRAVAEPGHGQPFGKPPVAACRGGERVAGVEGQGRAPCDGCRMVVVRLSRARTESTVTPPSGWRASLPRVTRSWTPWRVMPSMAPATE
jgi:hypothetical protein